MNIPEGVSKQLVHELQGYQEKIVILISNYKYLKTKRNDNPEDELIKIQIDGVSKLLEEYGTKQKPVIEKIRLEIKKLQTDSNNDENFSPQQNSSSKLNKTPESTKSLKLSKKSKKLSAKKKQKSTVKLHSFKKFKANLRQIYQSKYNALVTSVDQIKYDLNDVQNEYKQYQECEIPFKGFNTFNDANKEDYLKALGLLDDNDWNTANNKIQFKKQKMSELFAKTYIQSQIETEKKSKPNCNWLANEVFSPPLLRTRRGNAMQNAIEKLRTRSKRIENKESKSKETTPPPPPPPQPPQPIPDPIPSIETKPIIPTVKVKEKKKGSKSKLKLDKDKLLESRKEELIRQTRKNGATPPDTKSKAKVENVVEVNPLKRTNTEESNRRILPKRERTLTEKQRERISKEKLDAEKQLKILEAKKEEITNDMKKYNKLTISTRTERTKQNELLKTEKEVDDKIAKYSAIVAQYSSQLP